MKGLNSMELVPEVKKFGCHFASGNREILAEINFFLGVQNLAFEDLGISVGHMTRRGNGERH
jgi:hypothetical protein